jgi:Iap family predicted aminopeptidase
MTDDPRTAEAYQSALDLPSFRNLLQQIQAAKLLTRLVARDKRRDLIRLEKEIRVMAERVDRFYGVLGPRHWIFHESLPTDEIDVLLSLSPGDAERSLIALYADPELLRSFVRMILFRFPAIRREGRSLS